jgi:hypothetical protein
MIWPGSDIQMRFLRQVELDLACGADVAKACRTAGMRYAAYYIWRKKFGGMARPQVSSPLFMYQ